ncbi:unnamed protein product [Bursaphelenchus xylophilus]|uniref:(pine wood nematode) hypothetical protein n=1 Tax=Bursaphelenchus xylophilus TaxID=6326 RepID=A0A1I7RIX1_BURXY|nr:unnamed protein product [Bursaphelenchus xylophilus]CAG9119150.1 unnamed protein product [Bursaphelenchus xylophilus]
MPREPSDPDKEPLINAALTNEKHVFIPVHLPAPKKSKYRFSILLWLSFQTTFHSLLLIYSRSRPNVDIYLPSVAVLFTEIIKAIACMCIIKVTEKEHGLRASLVKHVINAPTQVLKMAVPAVLYTFQTNLLYLAATYIDPATFMVLQQLKIFSSAVSSVFLLNRRIAAGQWGALFLLFLGVCTVQLSRTSTGKKTSEDNFIGVLCVTMAAATSGFAGVYMERQLKSIEPVSIWMRNIQMGTMAIPASFFTIIAQDGQSVLSGQISLTRGFDFVAWCTVASAALGGMSVAACIKYADNIAKDFASATAIVMTTIGSIFLFNFSPSWVFCVGAIMVMTSTYLFSKFKPNPMKVEQKKPVVIDEDGELAKGL